MMAETGESFNTSQRRGVYIKSKPVDVNEVASEDEISDIEVLNTFDSNEENVVIDAISKPQTETDLSRSSLKIKQDIEAVSLEDFQDPTESQSDEQAAPEEESVIANSNTLTFVNSNKNTKLSFIDNALHSNDNDATETIVSSKKLRTVIANDDLDLSTVTLEESINDKESLTAFAKDSEQIDAYAVAMDDSVDKQQVQEELQRVKQELNMLRNTLADNNTPVEDMESVEDVESVEDIESVETIAEPVTLEQASSLAPDNNDGATDDIPEEVIDESASRSTSSYEISSADVEDVLEDVQDAPSQEEEEALSPLSDIPHAEQSDAEPIDVVEEITAEDEPADFLDGVDILADDDDNVLELTTPTPIDSVEAVADNTTGAQDETVAPSQDGEIGANADDSLSLDIPDLETPDDLDTQLARGADEDSAELSVGAVQMEPIAAGDDMSDEHKPAIVESVDRTLPDDAEHTVRSDDGERRESPPSPTPDPMIDTEQSALHALNREDAVDDISSLAVEEISEIGAADEDTIAVDTLISEDTDVDVAEHAAASGTDGDESIIPEHADESAVIEELEDLEDLEDLESLAESSETNDIKTDKTDVNEIPDSIPTIAADAEQTSEVLDATDIEEISELADTTDIEQLSEASDIPDVEEISEVADATDMETVPEVEAVGSDETLEELTDEDEEVDTLLEEDDMGIENGVSDHASSMRTHHASEADSPSPITSLLDSSEPSSVLTLKKMNDQDLKTIIQYMDNLLDHLPEQKIQEFAHSKYFEMYERLFDDLGISKS